MITKRNLAILFVVSLVLTILAHLFFLKEWTQEQYMVGPNDGLQQMVTFKKLLYEQYTSGNFFYSYQFGLGGGTYSQLSFYFATAFVFIITTGIVFVLESLNLVGTPDTLFWAQAAVFISICRLTLIIGITTLVFRYMKIQWLPGFVGASVYALSVIYFRHVVFWEFFADAMLWVPLLVLGVEKVIREARCGWLIAAIAITLFNNFYFAYVNLIFVAIYVVFRMIIHLESSETSKGKQCRLYIISGLLGFGISSVGFIPAVYGYLHNYRPTYPLPIEMIDAPYNIIYTSPYVVVPAIFLLFLFTFSLYKIPIFRVFAAISAMFILLHFSPYVASAFNGFSAPQYRWEYLLSFTMGGTVAAGLQYLQQAGKQNIIRASILVGLTYLIGCLADPSIEFLSARGVGMVSVMLLTLTLAFVLSWNRRKHWQLLLCTFVLLTNIGLANVTQYAISEHSVKKVSKSYLTSKDYNGEEQRTLLQKIKERNTSPFYRIDWTIGYLNNTPIVQDFNGFSAYSSILNQNLLYLYLYDLNIDMGRESVSRFSTLGNRANLYSLLQGKYMMREKENADDIPYGFKKIMESEHYVAFENTNILPFVRTTDEVFSEKEMGDAVILEREHAMLEGVIVADPKQKTNGNTHEVPNIIDQVTIETVGSSFKHNKLTVTEKEGGLDLIVQQPKADTKDYYVSFHLESLAESEGFAVKVNDYRTTRKHNQSIYKTYVDDLTIRVAAAEKISIRVPEGEYILTDLALYEENYQTLETAKKQASTSAQFKWVDNKLTITYNNQGHDRYMMLPIPYERGWQVEINHQKQPLKKVNYSFVGFPIKEGINHIEVVYYPPFFKICLVISIVSITLAVLFVRRKKYKRTN
ncbi:YfhO family protein [Halobacillus naozhouensis]|uniref:YfhO family protein n=1 Tax=Halobacillus naozhouensis TaxID=554880 RepID=A0ABY8IZK9_9BACI|nr:YfhO family protein [Halobacillus naozhouensis]WFT74061.1 YfhO family protein [Halobacillus naozhouensis]